MDGVCRRGLSRCLVRLWNRIRRVRVKKGGGGRGGERRGGNFNDLMGGQ